MSSVDRFDEIFRGRGGRYSPSTVFDEQLLERAKRGVAQQCLDPKLKSTLPPIEVGLIRNASFNACAALKEDTGFIGIYWGCHTLLFYVFNCMLAHRDVLPEVGNAQREVVDTPPLDFPPRGVLQFAQQTGRPDVIMPVDPERKKCARELIVTAFDFIVFHELAHITHGHVGLLNERCGTQTMSESPQEGLDPILQQTLEMDADCLAVDRFLRHLPNPEYVAKMGAPAERLLFDFVFAVYSVNRLWGFARDTETARHPAPDTRRNMILATVDTWIHENLAGQIDAAAFVEVVARAVVASEKAFVSVIGGEIPELDLKYSIYSSVKNEWQEKILAGWTTLYPDLMRLAFRSDLPRPK